MDKFSDRNDPFEESPGAIDDKVRDGIKKELARTDLSPEDRAQYESALQKLDENQNSA